nr:MAG TPA: hypothetical protein [Caudoviricetes sp.]
MLPPPPRQHKILTLQKNKRLWQKVEVRQER